MKNSLYQKSPAFLDKIKTTHYGNKIILSIDDLLKKIVSDQEIEFQSVIQDGRYVLIGPALLEGVKDQSKPEEVSNIVKAV